MPSLSTPRRLAFLSVRPFSSTAPLSDTATVSPAWKLSAPQTICLTLPLASPTSTVQRLSLSALGCSWRVRTLPTTKQLRFSEPCGAPTQSMPSTSVPDIVSSSASSSTVPVQSTYSRSQLTGTLISSAPLSEPPQEADVVVVEQAQVGDAVLEHRHALHTHAEGEAGDLLGVVVDEVVDRGVDHAGAHDLEPAGVLARAAALAAAEPAAHVHLDARLGEREEVRAHTDGALADLKGTVHHFTQEFFGGERAIRVRPPCFPFP